MFGTRILSNALDRSFVGFMGDQIITEQALSAAQRQETDTYIAQKYGAVGDRVNSMSSVVVPANTLTGGVTVNAYDLRTSASSNATATVLIDQVVDLRAAGASNDTVMVSGPDWVATGAGNDTVYLRDMNFRSIDGGQGYDRLVLDSSYTTAGSILLADHVSNARGNGPDATANARVNAAGYRKLSGFEQLVLSESPTAQALTVDAADVNQLSDGNTLGVVLGTNDSITATGFASATPAWGYYSFNDVVYDQRWTQTVGSDTYLLYARGQAPNFTAVSGATSGNDTLTGTSGNNLLQSGQANDPRSGSYSVIVS
jgi:hypothetical protein